MESESDFADLQKATIIERMSSNEEVKYSPHALKEGVTEQFSGELISSQNTLNQMSIGQSTFETINKNHWKTTSKTNNPFTP